MTLGGVRAFFRTRLDGLSYREWADGFAVDNIPDTVLNKAYHLDVGRIQISKTMGAQAKIYEFSYPVTLKVLSKGFRDPAAAIDAALDNAQAILADVLPASGVLVQEGFKSVSPVSLETLPLQVSNDNAVMLVMGFSVYLILSF